MHLLPYSLALLCAISLDAQSLTAAASSPPLSVPLVRRRPQRDSTDAFLKFHKDAALAKYGAKSGQRKRANGLNLLVNQGADSSFYGSLAIGTPATAYNVVLDTGSSDFWLAGSDGLTTVATGIPTFNPNTSSTFKNLESAFSIQYGLGAAQGFLGSDLVQMAGFKVDSQTFAVATQISDNLLQQPVSGLMGLAFETISTSGTTPFWEALANQGSLDQPLMAFQLTRFTDDQNAQELEPGGTFSLGAVNTSLFTGDIDFQDIPGGQGTYWLQEVTGLTANGNSVSLTSGSASYAAIDTGTSLVIGPTAAINGLYAQIPGSQALTGENAGYYTYPCSTNVNVTLRFGASTISWPVANADFVFQTRGETCIGSFIAMDNSASTPPWVVGDVFLKNVYSVYRTTPPSVGFAKLSTEATGMNGKAGQVPSATIGSVAATMSGSAIATGKVRSSNGAARHGAGEVMQWIAVGAVVVVGSLVL